MSSIAGSNTNNGSDVTSARLQNSKLDMAWEWGERRDPNNSHSVRCKLCGRNMSGGISRLKEHLAHIRGNVLPCTKVTQEIINKVRGAQQEVRKKKLEKERVQSILQRQDEEDEVEEQRILNDDRSGGTQEVAAVGFKRRKINDNVRGPMDAMMTVDNTKQSTLDKNNPHKQALKKTAWNKIAKWGYEVGLTFNAVRTPSFGEMIHAIGEYGRGMSPPSYHNYRVTLLNEVYQETKEFVDSFREHWKAYGCSIMSDFWTDGKHRCLINFLVNCPKGTVFLRSIDASEHVKSSERIVEMINDVISEVGVENIVSFQTDNASNYKHAGELLEEQHPTLSWNPCAAHCINLMLQDIGTKLPTIKSALAEAKTVVGFLYNHGRVLSWLRQLTNGRELHRSCVTRFATSFYTLRSIWENRSHVQMLFVSDLWRNSSFSTSFDGKNCEKIVSKQSFWNHAHFTCQVMAPLVDVLRLVDREEKPCMGYICEAMGVAKQQIEKNLSGDRRTCTKVWNIIDSRWVDQLHRPLHAAGYYLNPSIYYKQDKTQIETNSAIKSGLFKAMERLIPESDLDSAMDDLKKYGDARGTFGIKSAISRREKMQPHEWWMQYGSDTPSLTKFAIKVLSQTCSASPCERNWSAFDNLHSKKRNNLHQEKLNQLVYIQYNRKLEQRFKERQANGESDPIVLKEIDENDEWLIPTEEELDDFVRQGDNLTWEQVETTTRANANEGATSSRENANGGPATRTRRALRLIDEDEDEDDFNELMEGRNGGGILGRLNPGNDDFGSDGNVDLEV